MSKRGFNELFTKSSGDGYIIPQFLGDISAFKVFTPTQQKCVLRSLHVNLDLNPRNFDYVALLKPPNCLKKLALLFPTQLKMLHNILHGCLSSSGPLMSTLQIIHDKPLNFSTLPSRVSKERSNRPESFLGFQPSTFNQNPSPLSS